MHVHADIFVFFPIALSRQLHRSCERIKWKSIRRGVKTCESRRGVGEGEYKKNRREEAG